MFGSAPRTSSAARIARLAAANVAILVLLFVLLEGISSFLLLGRDVSATRLPAERRHTRHDSELGWVNRTNLFVPDMYGPGIALRTNAQGFRNDRDFEPAVPTGALRAICSGDSFTLGYGVGDSDTWCARLASKVPGLETVNMGQGGYGVDQAYLWYKRDAAPLEHDLHFFAVVSPDFQRMEGKEFMGYPKPSLDLIDGKLTVTNTPLKERSTWTPWLSRARNHLSNLRVAQLVKRVRGGMKAPKDSAHREERDRKIEKIARAIFEDLRRLNVEKGSRLILVHLPTLRLLGAPDRWRAFLADVARDLEIGWIDVTGVFAALESEDQAKLFIPQGALDYPGAAFHLNEEGNALAARVIAEALSKEPALEKHRALLQNTAVNR